MTFNTKRAAFAMLCTIAFLLIAPGAALAQDGGEAAGGRYPAVVLAHIEPHRLGFATIRTNHLDEDVDDQT